GKLGQIEQKVPIVGAVVFDLLLLGLKLRGDRRGFHDLVFDSRGLIRKIGYAPFVTEVLAQVALHRVNILVLDLQDDLENVRSRLFLLFRGLSHERSHASHAHTHSTHTHSTHAHAAATAHAGHHG